MARIVVVVVLSALVTSLTSTQHFMNTFGYTEIYFFHVRWWGMNLHLPTMHAVWLFVIELLEARISLRVENQSHLHFWHVWN